MSDGSSCREGQNYKTVMVLDFFHLKLSLV